jgi:hypothetical protein
MSGSFLFLQSPQPLSSHPVHHNRQIECLPASLPMHHTRVFVFGIAVTAIFVKYIKTAPSLRKPLQSAPDEPQEYLHPAYPAKQKFPVSECACDTVAQSLACQQVGNRSKEKERTLSGLSVGWTRLPSKRNRTEFGALPCRSQKASINFLSCVDRLILKNTSLLLSVTLMLRCSEATGVSGFSPAGDPSLSDMFVVFFVSEERRVLLLL